MGPVPERWYDYSKIGQVIPGTQFLACKTPLKMMLTEEERFTPEDLMELVKARGKNLAMVIDLTNTTRYYNKDRLENISYAKIFTPGRVIPSSQIVSQFFEAVESIEDKLGKDDVIAVHCTHGVNRTGYFICKYMVDKLKFAPQEAIDKFNTARGHKIEREIYLNSLKGETVAECESRTEMANTHYRWSPINHQFIRTPDHQRHNNPSFPFRNNPSNNKHYDQGPNHYSSKYPFSALNKLPHNKHYDQGPNQYRPNDVSYSAQNRPTYNEHYDQSPNHYRHENSSFSSRTGRPSNEYPATDYSYKNSPDNNQRSSYRNHRRREEESRRHDRHW